MNGRSRRPNISRLAVIVQMLGCALCLYPFWRVSDVPAHSVALLIHGVILLGFTLYHNRPGNFSVYPEMIKGARLIRTGPYRLIRHPMYASLMMFVVGLALLNRHWVNWVGVGMVAVSVGIKIRLEERYLRAADPTYAEYVKGTRCLVPFVF